MHEEASLKKEYARWASATESWVSMAGMDKDRMGIDVYEFSLKEKTCDLNKKLMYWSEVRVESQGQIQISLETDKNFNLGPERWLNIY